MPFCNRIGGHRFDLLTSRFTRRSSALTGVFIKLLRGGFQNVLPQARSIRLLSYRKDGPYFPLQRICFNTNEYMPESDFRNAISLSSQSIHFRVR